MQWHLAGMLTITCTRILNQQTTRIAKVVCSVLVQMSEGDGDKLAKLMREKGSIVTQDKLEQTHCRVPPDHSGTQCLLVQ